MYYVTSLIVKGDEKKNVQDKIHAPSREEAAKTIAEIYEFLGFKVVKQKVVLL